MMKPFWMLIIGAALAICILKQYTPDATGGATTAADVGKPNGAKVIELTLEGIEPAMIDLLNGGVPEGAQAKHLVGSAGDVWQYQDHYYLKTTDTLLAPRWEKYAASDGVAVYRLPTATQNVILSGQGGWSGARIE